MPPSDAAWAKWIAVPPGKESWIDGIAGEGGPVAKQYDLPIGAMLACASVECAWGTSKIYKATGNPFNLQKFPKVPFPHTHRIHWSDTIIAEGPPPVVRQAPFNCALNTADAVLQWCEWILHYGMADGPGALGNPLARNYSPADNLSAIANRDRLLASRHNSIDFCLNLPLVGFGENATPALRKRSGERYKDRLTQFGLTVYDS
jgi:hypothetical protein